MNKDPTALSRILRISVPAVISTLSGNLMMFLDRVFLSRYSLEDFSVAMPGGMLSFTVATLFIGIGWYVPSLVAQYYGADRPKDAARAVWQGIYFSFAAGVILLIASPFAVKLLATEGRPHATIVLAQNYFYLTMGANIVSMVTVCIGGFFNGRGETRIPMAANIAANVLNAVLAYICINGLFGIPLHGVTGAGVATLIASAANLLFHAAFFFNRHYRTMAYTTQAMQFDGAMMKKLLYFGFPSALQNFIDIGGWGIFIMFIEQTGRNAMAAASIAFNIEMIAFMPVMGLASGVGIIAGQEMGAKRPDNVWRVTRKGIAVALGFNAVLAALFIVVPGLFIMPFNNPNDSSFAAVQALALPLIRIVAAWVLFNAVLMTLMSVLRSAGDTFFIMVATSVSAPLFLVLPAYFIILKFRLGLEMTFWLIVAYIILLFFVILVRFLQGKWRFMQVIESEYS
ncbi:MAG: MATE family efflux transporter [Spirochaetes bacterium]|nr:MATE family efflux transporter [Spirochaetota bacterium]